MVRSTALARLLDETVRRSTGLRAKRRDQRRACLSGGGRGPLLLHVLGHRVLRRIDRTHRHRQLIGAAGALPALSKDGSRVQVQGFLRPTAIVAPRIFRIGVVCGFGLRRIPSCVLLTTTCFDWPRSGE